MYRPWARSSRSVITPFADHRFLMAAATEQDGADHIAPLRAGPAIEYWHEQEYVTSTDIPLPAGEWATLGTIASDSTHRSGDCLFFEGYVVGPNQAGVELELRVNSQPLKQWDAGFLPNQPSLFCSSVIVEQVIHPDDVIELRARMGSAATVKASTRPFRMSFRDIGLPLEPGCYLGGTFSSFTLNATPSKIINYSDAAQWGWVDHEDINPAAGEIVVPADGIYEFIGYIVGRQGNTTKEEQMFLELDIVGGPEAGRYEYAERDVSTDKTDIRSLGGARPTRVFHAGEVLSLYAYATASLGTFTGLEATFEIQFKAPLEALS